MKQQKFLNKNIIITAAADGIGLVIAEYCLNCGANVFLTDVNQKKLSKTLKKSADITTMTLDEYEIYIDDYTKKSKYPDINQ